MLTLIETWYKLVSSQQWELHATRTWRLKMLSSLVLFLLALSNLNPASAAIDPALRLGIHGKHPLSDSVSLSGHLIVCNFVKDQSALVYVGPRILLSEKSWVEIELGHTLYAEGNSVVLSPRLNIQHSALSVLTILDIYPQTSSWYHLTDAKYALGPVKLGVESENFGQYQALAASHLSVGPAVAIPLGQTLEFDAVYLLANDKANVARVSVNLFF